MGKSIKFLKISEVAEAKLIAAARDKQRVSGLTHAFYKYPARFSPSFVRSAIETFTKPGHTVLDPYVGGGTSLVEALALGRNGVGIDVSTLAEFVSLVKTTVYRDAEFERLESWAKRLSYLIDVRRSSTRFNKYAELGYYRHLHHSSRWRLRKAIEQALASAIRLDSKRLESFGRCVVLRTAQWALDGRKNLPKLDDFRDALVRNARDMIDGARALQAIAEGLDKLPIIKVLNRSTAGVEKDVRMRRTPSPKLVLTSPPYPGIHILYHRWQVDGRKETGAPFWIANKLDGAGAPFYAMGDRRNGQLNDYFSNITATMSSVAALADRDTIVVQMIAFSDARSQLPRYLEAMREAQLEEVFLPAMRGADDGRLWRSVPGRRWYSDQRGRTPGSREVVLIHRKVQAVR